MSWHTAVCYLWPDHQWKSQRSNCRMIHLHHTPHTHPSLSLNAAHHHSQTAGGRQAANVKGLGIKCLARLCLNTEWSQWCFVASTLHFPLRQAAVEPSGDGLLGSQRVPSTNWEPRLTMKLSPSDWHMYLHCSSPDFDTTIFEIQFYTLNKLKVLFRSTLHEAYSWDPRVERSCVWLKVQRVEVCLGTLLCHEIQLSALTQLQERVVRTFMTW